MSLEVFIDMSKFTESLADNYIDNISEAIQFKAERRVRVKSGNLKNSIDRRPIGSYKKIVYSEAPYAKAQEYGLGNKYGFTPYMRPSVIEVKQELNDLKIKAEKIARADSKVNKKL